LHRITTDLGTISRFSIHSNLIAVSGSRGGIGLWDALSGSWLGEIPAQNLPSFRWTSSGELEVFSAGMLRRWSPGGRTLIRGQVGEGIADVVASPDGRRIAVGTGGGKVHVYRREDGAVLEQYSLDSLVIKGMSFLPGGQELVVTTVKAGKSWLLSGGTARQLGTMRAHRRLTVLPSGELFATDLIEGLVHYTAPGAAADRLFLGATYLDLEAEPDGRHILLLDEHDNILRYDALTRQLHRLFSSSNVRSVAGTGSLVAVTRPDEVLLTTSSGQILHRLSPGLPDVRLTDVSISPHGPRIAAGSDDGRAFVWDGESGKLLAILPGHSDRVSTLEFCSDHNLVTGSWDHSFRIWDLELLETDPAALQDGIFRDAGLPIP
ncbi:MAG TPA: WD40 repeat domain-containing protein, partial [Myxococcota bacterium]|nr:WD40 repeat domain-containing protein [Myxococcota bacterium]